MLNPSHDENAEEISEEDKEVISQPVLSKLLIPYLKSLQVSTNKAVFKRIIDNIFMNIIRDNCIIKEDPSL